MAVERRQSIDEVLAQARRRIARLSPQEAAVAQAAGALVVDTRDQRDRNAEGAIPGALAIPLSVLPWRLDPDAPMRPTMATGVEQPIVLVCNDGFSSSLAGEWLVRMGFRDVSDIDGGFRAWAASGMPVRTAGDVRQGARRLAVVLAF